jgi:signal peptidase I
LGTNEPGLVAGESPILETAKPRPQSRGKRVAIALLLSLLFTGLGQLYNRQPRKGLWMAFAIRMLDVAVAKTRILLSFWGLVASILVFGALGLFIVGEAAYVAWTNGKPETAFRKPRLAISIIMGIILFLALLPLLGPYQRMSSYLRAFKVPSPAMCPTICSGERIVADMNAYHTKTPQRGDIILLQHQSTKELFTKRVIAVGGDTVEQGPKGTILVNGNALKAPEICGKPIVIEEVPGGTIGFPATTVPADFFFVVGDNLENSYDSRIPEFGFVSPSQVRGRPLYLYWSPGRSRIGCPIR